VKPPGGNPEGGERVAVQAHGPPDHRGIAAEAACPEAVGLIQHGEQRGVGADAEAQGGHDRESEEGRAGHRAERLPEVQREPIHGRP
jgi:hypothetical protein